MVAAYIGAAYWFTASTSFANPAAAFGRMFSDSFAGIAPASVPGFVVAELVGAGDRPGLASRARAAQPAVQGTRTSSSVPAANRPCDEQGRRFACHPPVIVRADPLDIGGPAPWNDCRHLS